MLTNKISIEDFEISKYTQNSTKSFLRKLSLSFGFVIVLMPIFGLLIVIGNIIDSKMPNTIVAQIFKNIGNLLFSNIGLWFALAIIIGFANNKGVAIYGGIIFYLIFTITTSVLIRATDDVFNILFWKNLTLKMYTTKTFGFTTFNSGVFGGLLCGTIVILLYNRLNNVKLPRGLEFFGGERFVLITIPLAAIILALVFAIIWPLFGKVLILLGEAVSKSPQGLDAFVFRMIQRMLIPFGTGMLWQAPFWYTNIGGSITGMEYDLMGVFLQRLANEGKISNFDLATFKASIEELKYPNLADFLKFLDGLNDGFLFTYKTELISWVKGVQASEIFDAVGDQFLALKALNTSGGLLIQDLWTLNVRASRFAAPGFSNSMFILPTLAVLMYLRIPKGERKEHLGMFVNATLTTLLLGVTEPIEFLFCYTAPVLFFFVYSPLNGITGYLTSLLEIKTGTAFSTGLVDFIFSGVAPYFAGNDTKFYLVPIVGVSCAALMGTITFFWFKKVNFSPVKTTGTTKKQLSAKILDVSNWLGTRKNIVNISLAKSELTVELKHEVSLINSKTWFTKIFVQNNLYQLSITEANQEVFQTLVASIAATNKIKSIKQQEKNIYKESLVAYKKYKHAVRSIAIKNFFKQKKD